MQLLRDYKKRVFFGCTVTIIIKLQQILMKLCLVVRQDSRNSYRLKNARNFVVFGSKHMVLYANFSVKYYSCMTLTTVH